MLRIPPSNMKRCVLVLVLIYFNYGFTIASPDDIEVIEEGNEEIVILNRTDFENCKRYNDYLLKLLQNSINEIPIIIESSSQSPPQDDSVTRASDENEYHSYVEIIPQSDTQPKNDIVIIENEYDLPKNDDVNIIISEKNITNPQDEPTIIYDSLEPQQDDLPLRDEPENYDQPKHGFEYEDTQPDSQPEKLDTLIEFNLNNLENDSIVNIIESLTQKQHDTITDLINEINRLKDSKTQVFEKLLYIYLNLLTPICVVIGHEQEADVVLDIIKQLYPDNLDLVNQMMGRVPTTPSRENAMNKQSFDIFLESLQKEKLNMKNGLPSAQQSNINMCDDVQNNDILRARQTLMRSGLNDSFIVNDVVKYMETKNLQTKQLNNEIANILLVIKSFLHRINRYPNIPSKNDEVLLLIETFLNVGDSEMDRNDAIEKNHIVWLLNDFVQKVEHSGSNEQSKVNAYQVSVILQLLENILNRPISSLNLYEFLSKIKSFLFILKSSPQLEKTSRYLLSQLYTDLYILKNDESTFNENFNVKNSSLELFYSELQKWSPLSASGEAEDLIYIILQILDVNKNLPLESSNYNLLNNLQDHLDGLNSGPFLRTRNSNSSEVLRIFFLVLNQTYESNLDVFEIVPIINLIIGLHTHNQGEDVIMPPVYDVNNVDIIIDYIYDLDLNEPKVHDIIHYIALVLFESYKTDKNSAKNDLYEQMIVSAETNRASQETASFLKIVAEMITDTLDVEEGGKMDSLANYTGSTKMIESLLEIYNQSNRRSYQSEDIVKLVNVVEIIHEIQNNVSTEYLPSVNGVSASTIRAMYEMLAKAKNRTEHKQLINEIVDIAYTIVSLSLQVPATDLNLESSVVRLTAALFVMMNDNSHSVFEMIDNVQKLAAVVSSLDKMMMGDRPTQQELPAAMGDNIKFIDMLINLFDSNTQLQVKKNIIEMVYKDKVNGKLNRDLNHIHKLLVEILGHELLL